MKKFCVLFCLMAMILSIVAVPAFAAEPEGKVIDLGGDYYMVETITQYPTSRSGDTVSGSKSGKLYYGSTEIGALTLTATFDISGSSAKAMSAYASITEKNGGKCTDKSAKCSGNEAIGLARFSYNGGVTKLELTISCSPDGTLS